MGQAGYEPKFRRGYRNGADYEFLLRAWVNPGHKNPDPVLSFQNSVHVQPQSNLFLKLKVQVQIKSKN